MEWVWMIVNAGKDVCGMTGVRKGLHGRQEMLHMLLRYVGMIQCTNAQEKTNIKMKVYMRCRKNSNGE